MIDILAGAFGSGKTELCLNFALASAGEHPVLADLDIVNPYFCSRDRQEALEAAGVSYIGPPSSMRFSEVPYITPQIIGAIRSERRLFVDVGGDESGSAVLGYLSQEILNRPYRMYLVINPFRPFTENEGKAERLRKALERVSRLQFTGVISNPNMAAETNVGDILEGHGMVEKMAREMCLPIRFLIVEQHLTDELRSRLNPAITDGQFAQVEIYPMQLHLRPEWM